MIFNWSNLFILTIFLLKLTTCATEEDPLEQNAQYIESTLKHIEKNNHRYHQLKVRIKRMLHKNNELKSRDELDKEYNSFSNSSDSFLRNSDKSNVMDSAHLPVDKSRKLNFIGDISEDEGETKNIHDRQLRDTSNDILWTHSEALDKQRKIILRWQPRHQEILFRVEARTKGYVGLGFSSNGKMEKADIILGWVNDKSGTAILIDCHGVPAIQGSAPVRDQIDNYTLMRGLQNDTHTVIEFRRAFDTCDPDDYVLSSDTVRVIWALHEHDPQIGGEMVYHGNQRGSQSLHLLSPPPVPKINLGHSSHWDVVIENFNIPQEMTTLYWCKVFKAPTLNSKHHIIGFEPLIGEHYSSMVHHIVMHECELDDDEDLAIWEQFAKEDGKLCHSNRATLWDKCLTPLVSWAIGSKGENFPSHVGLPLAEKRDSFYMLEVHFDNPTKKSASDTFGLRLHYTSELRENEAGILITGVAPSPLHFIPPYQNEYKTAGYCSIECTREVIPKEGINVVSVMLHSHLAARKMKLRHVRGLKELTPLAEDNHYDFNYQQSRVLSQDIPILPGDGLITECTYSTLNRNKPTLGGYSTQEEMCLAFILHYPRTPLAGCYSMPPVKTFFENLGIKEFYEKNMGEIEKVLLEGKVDSKTTNTMAISKSFNNKSIEEIYSEKNAKVTVSLKNAKNQLIDEDEKENIFDKLVIKEPQEFRNLTFTEHLHNMPYNDTMFTKTMEKFFYKGLHFTFCRKRTDSLAKNDDHIVKLPEFQEYEKKEKVHCSYRSKTHPTSQTLGGNINSLAAKSKVFWYLTFACITVLKFKLLILT